MKRCKNCGAIQSDTRSVCLDCGAALGKPMSEAEASRIEAALDDKLENMSDRTDDFYVPFRDKLMGVLCIFGIAAAILLIVLAGAAKEKLGDVIPDGVTVIVGSNFEGVLTDEAEIDVDSIRRMNALDDAMRYAIIAIICLAVACPMLLFPKFMWFLDTLKYRMFYGWDTTPSDFALYLRKIVTYIAYGGGMLSVIYGWFLYF